MAIKYYVLPEEREQMKKEAIRQAIISIKGPVGFYECWPGEGPSLTISSDAWAAWRPFCSLVCEDETRKGLCRLNYEERAAKCVEPGICVCLFGVHNAVCPVADEHGGSVTLIGGEFLVRERKVEAQERLEQFLQEIPPGQIEAFRKAWRQIPEVSEAEVLDQKMRELELAGRGYLLALKQRSDLRYKADLATHDVIIALQALIAEIEVLKIELKRSFNIGKKWEERFETLLQMCEEHHKALERKLDLGKPEYAYHSIVRLICECVDLYVPHAQARGIEFRVDLERTVDEEGEHKVLAVRMDRVALRQALRNALDNAVKYSFDGTPDHPRRIEVIGRLARRQKVPGYAIYIKNLGIGIEEDELKLVFEPGYQGRRRLNEERSGYGMGLAFVKECVERNGGAVALHSEPPVQTQPQSLLPEKTGWLTTLLIWLPLQGPSNR